MGDSRTITAFAGSERIASGDDVPVALAVKALIDEGDQRILLIFDDSTAEQVEMDLRGTPPDIAARLSACAQANTNPARLSPGRPRLGVVGREVTLLPRHWEWLSAQPGGASAALRRLVDQARHDNEGKDTVRRSQEAAYRFMFVMAGNERGFEEATRSLFAADSDRFDLHTGSWPRDVREYARGLAADALAPRHE